MLVRYFFQNHFTIIQFYKIKVIHILFFKINSPFKNKMVKTNIRKFEYFRESKLKKPWIYLGKKRFSLFWEILYKIRLATFFLFKRFHFKLF